MYTLKVLIVEYTCGSLFCRCVRKTVDNIRATFCTYS